MPTKIMYIVRGPSGTGKSTIARHLGGEARRNWFEADMFFESDAGYHFDPRGLGEAHRWCTLSVDGACRQGLPVVIVSNTFCPVRDMNAYLDIAQAQGYRVEIIRTPGPWDLLNCNSRNTHSVPQVALQRQLDRYVAHPDEHEWDDMSIFG